MQLNRIKTVGVFGLLLMSHHSFATPVPAPSLGDIAENFLVGSDAITRLALAVCIVVSAAMFVLGITHYRAHRENPKMVPLGKPVMYIVLGFCLVMIPFFGKIFGKTGSILELKNKRENAEANCPIDIDAPLEFGNEFNH